MADSNITKRALAAALKELMAEVPFSKITVADICEKCGMNRKSFYYHFRDKYDLVNWIYDTEFIAVARKKTYDTSWEHLADVCQYFYQNRDFYRKALMIEGQNSFSEHFREMVCPVFSEGLREILGEQNVLEFHINFFTDAFVCTLERWILNKNCVLPEEFVALLKSCVRIAADSAATIS